MQKSLNKLVLRKETVRALTDAHLARVVGGQDTDKAPAVAESNPKQCGAPAAAPGG
jgi:hypothetical protein